MTKRLVLTDWPKSDTKMNQNILNFTVYSGTKVECVDEINHVIADGQRGCDWLACINPHSYVVASRTDAFANALRSANWLVPDGIGIVVAGHILGRSVRERITGADVFEGVMKQLDTTGGSVFFLGASEKTLDLIRKKLPLDFPSIRLAGTFSPPFKPTYSETELDEMVLLIKSSRADVLWVGMTAPKQEMWILSNRHRLEVSFAGAIGAVFDFYSGQVRRSNPLFRRLGLEWLPRLLQQPRRLWRRMFISAPLFLLDVIRARFKYFFSNVEGSED